MKATIRLLAMKQFKRALQYAEQEIILAAMLHTCGNESAAARLLGMSRGKLRSRLKGYSI